MATNTVNENKDSTDVEPFTEQEPFLYDRHRYYGYISGVGAGKTAVGVMRAALNAEYWNPGRMGAIVAPTTQMIKNAILPLMREFGLMRRWDYKGPQAEAPGIHTPNGSRIVILSADNERQIERLASLNLGWFWVDESRDVPTRARQILIQRLRAGDYTNGFFTSTPRGKNHDYDFFVGNVDADEYNHGGAVVYETGDRLAITSVPTDANPYLDKSDVQAIRDAHPSGILQQEVEGNFVEVGSGLLTEDMLLPPAPKDVLDSTELSFHVGVDLGVEADAKKARDNDSDHWAASIVAYHRRHGKAYWVDYAKKRGMTMNQGVEWLKKVVQGVPQPRIAIEAVQAQRFFLQACKDAGLNVYGVDQSLNKEDRIIQASIPVENGRVKPVNFEQPPEEGLEPRWDDMVSEWIAFPEGRHDDVIDSFEIAIRDLDIGATYNWEGSDLYGRDSTS